MKKAWFLSYPLSAQRRRWSDWADAQAELSLRWAHIHFVGFVMLRLKCAIEQKSNAAYLCFTLITFENINPFKRHMQILYHFKDPYWKNAMVSAATSDCGIPWTTFRCQSILSCIFTTRPYYRHNVTVWYPHVFRNTLHSHAVYQMSTVYQINWKVTRQRRHIFVNDKIDMIHVMKKTCLRGLRPGNTQTGLLSYRDKL